MTIGEFRHTSQDDVDKFDVEATCQESAENLSLDSLLRLLYDVAEDGPELLPDEETEKWVRATDQRNDDSR